MEIDHIFIFSSSKGKEAEELRNFGLTEGSNRVHPGQGTTNRKFYFRNFFLEILWVVDEDEIKNEVTGPTKLSDRALFYESRFGLGLLNDSSTDQLFQSSDDYQPHYFPKGMTIDIIPNAAASFLPWTFRLPYRGKQNPHNEPVKHKNNIKKLTQTTFEVKAKDIQNDYLNFFKSIENITFKESSRTHLTLVFDNKRLQSKKEFPTLNLTIEY